MKNLLFVTIIGLTVVILQSCKDQYDFSTDKLSSNVETTSEFAIPLVNASVTLQKFLPEDDSNHFLQIGDDNFITMIFNYTIEVVPATDYFDGKYSGTLDSVYYEMPVQVYDLGMDRLLSFDEFYIADPRITISLANFWDIPVQFRFIDFNYYLSDNSPGIPATGSFVTDWHNVIRPVAPQTYAVTELRMDNTNSNIDEIVSAMPNHISFGSLIGNSPGTPFEVSPLTADTARLKIEVPFDLRISNLILTDTFAIKIGQDLGKDTSKLESAQLNLIFENGFPLDIDAQIYFTDNNYTILDSISTDKIIISSGIVSDGKVTNNVNSTEIIRIEGDKKSSFLNSSYLIARFKFNTAGNLLGETVKFYSNYQVGLKIGALVKLKL